MKKYRSEAFAAIYETMEALHEVGAITKQTMREFDEACLSPIGPDEGNDDLVYFEYRPLRKF
jgi:DNA-binding transcriptional regulator YiaG